MDMLDIIFKVMALLVIPTFGWVWKTHMHITKMQVEFDVAKEKVKEMEPHKTDIAMIKQSLSHMSEKLDEIKTLISVPRST
jgi:hypothetical protein